MNNKILILMFGIMFVFSIMLTSATLIRGSSNYIAPTIIPNVSIESELSSDYSNFGGNNNNISTDT